MSGVDMKAVEIAAASLDARVRGAAMRRMEIEKEIEPLDTFLNFYAGEVAAAPVAVLASTQAKAAKPVSPRSEQREKGKTEKMIDAVVGIIVENGRPMTLSDLFDGMSKKHPDLCLSNVDSMRARLAEHKSRIGRVNGRGYWPADMEAPSPDA